jgi:heme oxygenase
VFGFDIFRHCDRFETPLTMLTTACSLAQRLRAETAEAHAKLEAVVGFDIHRPSVATATAMLESFYRVLATLEPAMMALLPFRLRDRQRLCLLSADLAALGRAIDPRLEPSLASAMPRNEAEAMGALYVMEGSTLGGKLIAKSLRTCSDWPVRGICYFNPYGERTGAMWAAFQLELAAVPTAHAESVVRGANQTFAMMEAAMAQETV